MCYRVTFLTYTDRGSTFLYAKLWGIIHQGKLASQFWSFILNFLIFSSKSLPGDLHGFCLMQSVRSSEPRSPLVIAVLCA